MNSVHSGRCGQLELYAALVILLHGSLEVQLGERNLLRKAWAEVIQHCADDRVVRNLAPAAVFEYQQGSRLFGNLLGRGLLDRRFARGGGAIVVFVFIHARRFIRARRFAIASRRWPRILFTSRTATVE